MPDDLRCCLSRCEIYEISQFYMNPVRVLITSPSLVFLQKHTAVPHLCQGDWSFRRLDIDVFSIDINMT